MNKIRTKLLLCLSSPDLSDAEFKEFVELLHSGQFNEIIGAADHLRRTGRDILKTITRSRVDDDFVKYIQSMLIQEGRMTPHSAIRSLLMELRDEPVPSRKWTVRSGLEFALTFSTESDIAAAARHVLAKQSSDPNKHAWSLKKTSN